MFSTYQTDPYQARHILPHHSRAKLTPSQRDEIRARLIDGEEAQALALEFNVSASSVRKMK